MIPSSPRWSLLCDGHRPRVISPDYMRAQRDISARHHTWPAFSQLIVHASPAAIRAQLATQLDALEIDPDALRFATTGPITALAEPRVDMGLRAVGPELADVLMDALQADGALVTKDVEDTLSLIIYRRGAPTLSWCDPLIEGAGIACSHLDDGRYVEEDSRLFALRMLGLDEDTDQLDRYAFIELMLKPLGLHHLSPDLAGLRASPLF